MKAFEEWHNKYKDPNWNDISEEIGARDAWKAALKWVLNNMQSYPPIQISNTICAKGGIRDLIEKELNEK